MMPVAYILKAIPSFTESPSRCLTIVKGRRDHSNIDPRKRERGARGVEDGDGSSEADNRDRIHVM
jgi:hypothetical protein